MKEMYAAPELDLIGFVPSESLANGTVDYDDFGNPKDEYWNPAEEGSGDLDFEFSD